MIVLSSSSSLLSSSSSLLSSLPKDDIVKDVGVFLLGSMIPKYYNRIESARRTWAARVKVFFMVTGDGEPDNDIISSNQCINMTSHYNNIRRHRDNLYEVYECSTSDSSSNSTSVNSNNDIKIHVLHLRYCNNKGMGAEGPCCRCNGAMKFFLDQYMHLSNHHHHSVSGSVGGGGNYPSWFVFSDDDYYIRVEYLEALLTSSLSQIDMSQPYTIIPWGNGDVKGNNHININIVIIITAIIDVPAGIDKNGQKRYTGRTGYGGLIYNSNCTAQCVHRFGWQGILQPIFYYYYYYYYYYYHHHHHHHRHYHRRHQRLGWI